METRASYVLVGAFVVALFTALAGFAWWFTGGGDSGEATEQFEVVLTGTIEGLSVGSQVRYRGIPVGRVTKLVVDEQNFNEIIATIEVADWTPVREDTTAQIDSQGLTGVPFIQLLGGSVDSQPLPLMAKIQGVPSPLEEFTTSAPDLVRRLNRVFNYPNRLHLQQILENLATVSAKLPEAETALAQLITDAQTTVADVTLAAERAAQLIGESPNPDVGLQTQFSQLAESGQATLASIRSAADEIGGAGANARAITKDLRRPIADFANGTLYDFDQLVDETRQLVATLTRVSRELERNPRGFLFGDQGGFQAPR
jgi:phospholipid/cholesterol/gamma-HCH transport system substrate-binding protein